MILRNVAGQSVLVGPLIAAADGSAVTSGASMLVEKDGAQAASAGTLAHAGSGVWRYTPTQAETDAARVGLILSATGAIAVAMNLITTTLPVQTSGAIPAAAAGTSGGLPLAGTGGKVPATLAASDVSGTLNVSATLAASQPNYAPAKAGDAMAVSGYAPGQDPATLTGMSPSARTLTAFSFPVVLATSQPNYAPAKAGDAMAVNDKTGFSLTTGERDAIATRVEAHLLDEGDSQMLINAIVAAIGNTNIDQVALIAAIRADLERAGGNLNTVLGRIGGNVALAGTAPGWYAAPPATATLAALQPNYAPAKAGDAMSLTAGERTALGLPIAYVAPNNAGIAAIKVKTDALPANFTDATFSGPGVFSIDALANGPAGSGGGGSGATPNQVADAVLSRVFTGSEPANSIAKILGSLPTVAEYRAEVAGQITATTAKLPSTPPAGYGGSADPAAIVTAINSAGVKLRADGLDLVIVEGSASPPINLRRGLSVVLAALLGDVSGADTAEVSIAAAGSSALRIRAIVDASGNRDVTLYLPS